MNKERWQALATRVERWKRLIRTTYYAETRGAEFVSAGVLAASWFLFLLLAGNTFDSSETFTAMKRLGNETAWSMVAGLVSLIQIGGLAFDNLKARTVGTALAATYYATISVAIHQANPLTTGWVTYGVLAVVNLWALRRMQ